MNRLIIAGTGHRPNKILYNNKNAYDIDTYNRLKDIIINVLECIDNPYEIISGMALGFDMALAEAAIDLDITFTAAVPFIGQESIWPQKSQDKYKKILSLANRVYIVNQGGYSAQKLQLRNQWMVDNCHLLLGLWNGSEGGTKNCFDYATKQQKLRFNLWNLWSKDNE